MPFSVPRRMPGSLTALLLLGACATQADYRRSTIATPASWANGSAAAGTSPTVVDRDGWWRALGDPAIDALVEAALRDNPTLGEAAARVDLARAVFVARNAERLPNVAINGSANTARDRLGVGTDTVSQTAAGLGLNLAWEIDLWGRVREGRTAARVRIAARAADAEGARISLIGDIADNVLALRACQSTLAIRDSDIGSREIELNVSRARLSLGSIAPVVVAASETNLAAARTERVVQAEACQRLVNALVALSGIPGDSIRERIASQSVAATGTRDQAAAVPTIPEPPAFVPALPATVLLAHPAVVAAEREVAARWSEIGVARAERLPRFDLAAALTGQWIRMLGASSTATSNSLGLGLTVPLFDGGAGAANVRGAQAAYREAAAQLVSVVRAATRDIEDGLVAQQSASLRVTTARDALTAARFTLRANEARWRAGAIAQYELEETRRLFRSAQESAVVAAADRARAWVALVRRTGPAAADAIPAMSPAG